MANVESNGSVADSIEEIDDIVLMKERPVTEHSLIEYKPFGNLQEQHPSKIVVWMRIPGLPKPLKAFIGINGTPYYVEYEGLSSICYQRGCYGHTQENYLKLIKNMEMSHPTASTTKPSPPMAKIVYWS
ncbi:hypothetical protein CXB51_034126 [Gossypium anomalum]|uniref:DUF4283 domain-containing protein n=1 Tax=Gossypium anomalum TaxID=47600 RepID=A0A8J6CKV3_9ROSI|nr:hypothetical protein CXB51_034126 [Gossypium anomalum]